MLNENKRGKILTIPGYENFLCEKGYKKYTPSGLKSTVFQYSKAIEDVISREMINNINVLANKIDALIREYDFNGPKSEFGARGHGTVINALKRFKEYVEE